MFFINHPATVLGYPHDYGFPPIQSDPWVAQGEMSNARVTAWTSQFFWSANCGCGGKGQGKGMQGIPSGNLT